LTQIHGHVFVGTKEEEEEDSYYLYVFEGLVALPPRRGQYKE
jgi:hypothetical protein